MEEIVEALFKNAGQKGLSIRHLKQKTGLSKNAVKRIIFNSKNIFDCPPSIHGSYKQKIHVYVYTPSELMYKHKKEIKNKRKTIEQQIEPEIK